MEDDPPTPKAEFMMAIVGPLSSCVISLFSFLLYTLGKKSGWPITVNGVLNYLGWLNIILAVFNLMPAFPLDGGRVLRSALWSWKKDMRWATSIAGQVGSGFGIVLIIMGIVYIVNGNFVTGMWWFLIGMFLRSSAQLSYKQLLARNLFNTKKVNDLMVKNPVTVPRSISLEEFVRDYVYKHHFQMYPVLSFGKLTGCISVKQLAAIPRDEWSSTTVGAVASSCSPDITISPGDDANKALEIMNRTGNSRLLVVQDDELQGIIVLKDMLNLLSLKMELNDLGDTKKEE